MRKQIEQMESTNMETNPFEVILAEKRLEGAAIRECYPSVEAAQEALENLAAVECWQRRETLLELISHLIEDTKVLGDCEGRQSEEYTAALGRLRQCIGQSPIEAEREEMLEMVEGLEKLTPDHDSGIGDEGDPEGGNGTHGNGGDDDERDDHGIGEGIE